MPEFQTASLAGASDPGRSCKKHGNCPFSFTDAGKWNCPGELRRTTVFTLCMFFTHIHLNSVYTSDMV